MIWKVLGGTRGLAEPVLADLVPSVLADEVGGDPVEPRPGIGEAEVVALALAEGGEEGLRHEVVGDLPAGAPGEVTVDVRGVPVEQLGEELGLVPGALDDRCVVRGRKGGVPGPLHTQPCLIYRPFSGCGRLHRLSVTAARRVHGSAPGARA